MMVPKRLNITGFGILGHGRDGEGGQCNLQAQVGRFAPADGTVRYAKWVRSQAAPAGTRAAGPAWNLAPMCRLIPGKFCGRLKPQVACWPPSRQKMWPYFGTDASAVVVGAVEAGGPKIIVE